MTNPMYIDLEVAPVSATGQAAPAFVGPPGTTSWSGLTDKPEVIAAGPTATEARQAIGAVADDDARLSDARPPTPHTHGIGEVDGLAQALAGKAETTDPRLSDARPPTGGAGGVLSGQYPNPGFAVDMATQGELDAVNAAKVDKTARGAANGVASLDASGKVPASELPAIAITDVFTVASQAAMLALTAERGDVAVRSDLNKSFALAAEPASTLANWVELRTPTDAVLSVAGKTGAVTLGKADVGLSNVDNTADSAKPVSTAQAAAIATATAIHPFLLIGA